MIFNQAVIQSLLQELMQFSITRQIGLLHKAIQITARKSGKEANSEFFKSCGISNQATIEQDVKVLSHFGFPADFLLTSGRFGKTYIRSEVATLLIAAAAYILLGVEEMDRSPVAVSPLIDLPPAPPPKTILLSLALVLKARELGDIQTQTINFGQVIGLLERASYSLCAFQAEMREIERGLIFENLVIDYNSQQPVLVVIEFEYTQLLLSDRTFANKLELKQLLREDSKNFCIISVKPLAKVGELTALGFIRT